MAKKKEVNHKANKVLKQALLNDPNSLTVIDAKEQITDLVLRLKGQKESLSFQYDVKDLEEKHWKHNEHFVKIFHFEMRHIEEYYSVNKSQKSFLFELGEFLMWQTNLLVDEYDNPLNQKSIAEKLNINTRTVQRNMDALEERHIIHKIQIGTDVYYIVNPYVMFIGQNINIAIPKLFDDIGYIKSVTVDKKNSRSNRSKEQKKRITVG